jgi:tellurite resistance protein
MRLRSRWAAVATVVLIWFQDGEVAGYRVWLYLVLAAITLLIGGIGVRTLLALARGQFLPRPPEAQARATGSAPAPVPGPPAEILG